MGYKTITTKIASARSTKSKQTTSYQYPTGNGVVLTGSSINSQTSAYLDVTTPGAARTFTAVSGGAGTSTVISNIQYLDANNVVANAIAASTTGGNILINGNGFANTSRVYVNNQLVTNTFVNSNAIIATLSANSVGNVTLAVFNSSGQSGVFSNSNVRFSGAPSWVTAAAVSSVNGIASNIALQASGDGTLTYSLKSGSGSLPTGITLLSSGYLTGTATGYSADTVVSFTLIVSDPESQETQQNFNYTVFIGDTYFKQTSLLLSATVSNTFISDSSTNNFLITRNGDTRPSRLSPYWPGGWSGYFDGTGQNFVTVSTGSGVAFGTGDYTVEGFCYATSWPSTWRIISFNTSAVCGLLNDATNGSLKIDVGAGAVSTGITLTLNRWFHIAVVRQSGTLRIYIDGVQGYSVSNTTNYTTSQSISLGGVSGFTQTWDGYLSNFRIVKGTAVYTANFTPATSSLTTIGNVSMLTLRDSILADDSPLNSAITRGGTARLTTFSPFNTAPHTVTANTNSVYFDGTTDSLSVPASSEFAYGTGNFTVEGWIYPMSSGDQMIYAQSVGGTNYFIFNINANVPKFIFATSGGGTFITSSISAPLNSWSHVAIVREGTGANQTKIYVNGLLGVSSTCAQDFTNTTYNPTIGGYTQGGNTYNGYVSNFRILKGTALYTANFTPASSALTTIANTSLLACQANTIIDSNTTPKTITINGNPNVSLANPFGETVTTINNYTWSPTSYGASAYFDGTGDNVTFPTLTLSATAWTIECWVYLTSATIAQGLFNFVPHNTIGISLNRTGALETYVYIGNGSTWVGSPAINSSVNFNRSAWNHIALVRNSGTITLYHNGVAVGTTSTMPSGLTGGGTIGALAGSQQGNEPLTGYISDFRIVNGTALYTTSFIPPAAPVSNVANVSLLTLQSDIGSNSAQFVDQSPNNHLITRNGNASQGTYGPLVPSTWSAYFDGTGDYLSIPRNAAFLPLANEDFTFEAWIYLTSTPGAQGAVVMGTGEYGLDSDWNININSSLRVVFYLDATLTEYINTTGTVAINTWNHVAVSRSGTGSNNLKVFLNGLGQSFTTNSTTVSIGNRALTIGADQNGDEFNLTGYISNLRIVKGTALYTANFTPSTTTISPVANTSLLTLRGPAFTDDSGNNFTITRFGDTKIVPFGPFSPQIVTPDSYSYRFSNASDYISTTSSNLAFGSNNWTIESWVYPRFTANSGVFQVSNVQYGLTNSNLNTVALGFSNSNKAIVRVANATYTSTGTSITANAWTHLALVKNSNVSKLYINGTLDSTIGTSGSITDTVSYTGTTNVAVGGYGSTSALANAYISNFRIVSNSAVYTENFTPAVGPLSAISGTTLLTCQANTVLDSSAANLTITANANVSPSSFNPFDETVTVGQQYSVLADGGSVYFDGNGDYLRLTAAVLGSGNFSIEFWVYPIELRSNAAYFDQTSGFLFRQDTANILVYDRTTNLTILTTSGNLCKAFHWNHIAVVRASGIITVYINGINAGSASNTTNFNATDTYIGAFINNQTTGSIYGYLANFRILNGTALYTANFVPPAAPALPTVANTSLLLNFTSSGVIDSTGRNVLETVADAKVTTNLKKYGTGSYYFDGTGDYLSIYDPSYTLSVGIGDFTLECWVYVNSLPANVTSVYHLKNDAALATTVFVLEITSTGAISISTGTALIATGTSGKITTGSWIHFAFVRTSGVFKTFFNGTQDISTANTTTYNGTYLQIGAWRYLGIDQSLNGYIDDLRITKGYARYTANFTVPSEPFITK